MKLADGREVVTDAVVPGARYNVYDCEEGHGLLSLDIDEGVTPMFIACPDDGKAATSRFYRGFVPGLYLPVRMVWRAATRSELKRERREGGTHFAMGGLSREWV